MVSWRLLSLAAALRSKAIVDGRRLPVEGCFEWLVVGVFGVFFFTCCVSSIRLVKLILYLFRCKIFYTFYYVCYVVKWLVKVKFFQSNLRPKAKMRKMFYT